MKRLFPLLVLLVLALAGCGSATTQATTPTPTATIHVGSVTNSDGSITVTHPDGSTTTYWPSPTLTPTPTQAPAPSATVAGACGSNCGVASTPQPPAAPAHTYSGDGSKTTETFSVSDIWTIAWTCDATNNYGVEGVLVVGVYDSQGNLIDDLSETCKAGITSKGTSQEHQGGDVYLKIDGSVPWTIQIQDNG